MSDENQQAPTFEEALARLEQIVHDLEEGQVGLAESLARYEQGVNLLKQCYLLLETAERRIELVSGVDASGNPITEPFDAQASLDREEKGEPRTRRRTAKTSLQIEVTETAPATESAR